MKSSAQRSDADNRVRERSEADKIVCVTFVSESAPMAVQFASCAIHLSDCAIQSQDCGRNLKVEPFKFRISAFDLMLQELSFEPGPLHFKVARLSFVPAGFRLIREPFFGGVAEAQRTAAAPRLFASRQCSAR